MRLNKINLVLKEFPVNTRNHYNSSTFLEVKLFKLKNKIKMYHSSHNLQNTIAHKSPFKTFSFIRQSTIIPLIITSWTNPFQIVDISLREHAFVSTSACSHEFSGLGRLFKGWNDVNVLDDYRDSSYSYLDILLLFAIAIGDYLSPGTYLLLFLLFEKRFPSRILLEK